MPDAGVLPFQVALRSATERYLARQFLAPFSELGRANITLRVQPRLRNGSGRSLGAIDMIVALAALRDRLPAWPD
jgi:hypothetical protein